jgi:sodium bicarbonate cotransporter 7
MRKIPRGAEASNVLIGEVESLTHQLIAFIRLSKSVLLGDLTEVPVPTRFMFILLGPTGQLPRYHEIGRSIATMMSDEVCDNLLKYLKPNYLNQRFLSS